MMQMERKLENEDSSRRNEAERIGEMFCTCLIWN